MTYMVRLATLSEESATNPDAIIEKLSVLHVDLLSWWETCPPRLRDQTTDRRRLPRPRKLTILETLEEAFSSCKSCMKGCLIYLHHLRDPLEQDESAREEVIEAITFILETAKETPEGFGLEMGLYWGLFMAGVAILNDEVAEEFIRHKLTADTSVSIYVGI